MSQHYTRNTVSAAAWCNKCGKETEHTVSDRRLGYCVPCYNKPIPAAAPKPAPEAGLFDDFDVQITLVRGDQ
jgi:hypothetical protein